MATLPVGATDTGRSATAVTLPVPLRRMSTGVRQLWATTPGRLGATRIALVVLILLTGALGAAAAQVRLDATRAIARQRERASSATIEAYRDLADADATAAAGFLPGSAAGFDRIRFEEDIQRAAASLATATASSRGDTLALDRISDITASLTVYAALVERAAGSGRAGSSGGAEMAGASELMQSTILRRAEALQRDQASQLDAQYERAATPPFLSACLGLALVTLGALVLAQVWLFLRTRRIVNVGLAAATAAVLGLALWWSMALVASQHHLDRSQRHSRSVSDALGQAQIAARQARTSELLALGAGPESAVAHHEQFSARLSRLSRDGGAGGALGAARHLTSTEEGSALVLAAVRQVDAWPSAHAHLRRASEDGRQGEAVALAAGLAAEDFDRLDLTLAHAVAGERDAFRDGIDAAQHALRGLAGGTALLAITAAAGASRGIGRRLEEYR